MNALKWTLIIGGVLVVGYVLMSAANASVAPTGSAREPYWYAPPAAPPPNTTPSVKGPAMSARTGSGHF